MGTLAVIILTKNEEKHMADVIHNVQPYATEVIIVDAGSTDGTVEIAKNLGAKVAYREWDNDFAAQRNFGLTQTTAQWVLYLDADERLTAEIGQALLDLITADQGVQIRSLYYDA